MRRLNDQLISNSETTSPAASRPVERITSGCGSSDAAARAIAPPMAATSSQVKVAGPVSRFT
jgi:fructoselysine-6-P-deglycase FrlB-like protein